MKTYKLDLMNKTLTITKAFEDAVNTGEGMEYDLYMKFQKEIPGLKVVRRTHKTPTKYKSKSGKVSRCNPNKNLTYKNMEDFILALPDSEELWAAFHCLRDSGNNIQTSKYATVRRWFLEQFPKYTESPLYYFYNKVEVVSIVPFLAGVA